MDLNGILTFDQALKRGWHQFHPESKTVQVVLGAANATPLHWGSGRHLYYAVEFGGACQPEYGLQSPPPGGECLRGSESVVLDAHSGQFIVAGT